MGHTSFHYVDDVFGKPPDNHKVKSILKQIADRIISETTYQITELKNENPPVKLESDYLDWKYWNGIIHMAMNRFADLTGDPVFREYSIKNYDFFESICSKLETLYEHGYITIPGCQFFRLDRLDDFGTMSAALMDLIDYQKNSFWKNYIDKCTLYLMEKQDRLDNSLLCRRKYGYTTIWADDMYMSIPFLLRLWKFTGLETFINDAILQVDLFREYLYDPEKGLFHHCYYDNLKNHGAAYWGRANGWTIMAQCEILEFLQDNHPAFNHLKAQFTDQLIELSRYQNANGMWHQLLDKPDSFEETSCTAMFTYGYAKAVNNGWLDEIYTSIAVEGWKGIEKYIDDEGRVDGVSSGFNIRQDLPYYFKRPIEKGGDHGVGAFMMAGIEICKMDNYQNGVWS